jgi:hypothetical protein
MGNIQELENRLSQARLKKKKRAKLQKTSSLNKRQESTVQEKQISVRFSCVL